MTAEEDARQRAHDERTQQYPIDRSQKPVADARDQGQRHGMGDVGADETGDRGARVEQNESRHADGAGADRGERHEHPEQEPGEGRQCRGPLRIRLRMPRRGQQTQPPMRQDADRGHDKGDAQSGGDQGGESLPLMIAANRSISSSARSLTVLLNRLRAVPLGVVKPCRQSRDTCALVTCSRSSRGT